MNPSRLALTTSLVSALTLLVWSQGPSVAMLTDVGGDVVISGQHAKLFDCVPQGATLEADSNSRWTLSFVRAGRKVSGGQGHYKVDTEGVVGSAQAAPLRQSTAPSLKGVALDRSLNWDRMGGIRRSGNLEWLTEVALEEPDATIAWKSSSAVQEVELMVEKLPTYERIVKKALAANPGRFQIALQAGESYQLILTGKMSNGAREELEPLTVHVLSLQELAQLRSLESENNQVELCYCCAQLGLKHKSAGLARQLLTSYPNEESLKILARSAPP